MSTIRLVIFSIWFLGLVARSAAADVNFDRDIRPIFAQKCLECHGTDKAKGGLKLTDLESAVKELKSGAKAIVVGRPGESELIKRVTSNDPEERMPPKGDPLSAAQAETLKKWIAEGAKWEIHWAYLSIVRPEIPTVKNTAWGKNAIDTFVLARLEKEGIKPSPEADRYTLMKRLYVDLLGLTPDVSEVDAFIADQLADAYERLVDRLLASPHFGERWGRHWLDKARYADSDGYEKDSERPDAYRYRDWVIDAINRDMPFDEFTVEQLAGDLLPKATQSQKIATAFHRQTLTNKEGGVDQEQFRNEALFDRTETTGTVWLGLTVGCARCHSHKYDQISQTEYYSLFAFFNNGEETTIPVPRSAADMAQYKKDVAAYNAKLKGFEDRLETRRAAVARRIAAWQYELQEVIDTLPGRVVKYREEPLVARALKQDTAGAQILKQIATLKATEPKSPILAVRVISQRAKDLRATHLLTRGDFLQPGEVVTPAVLGVLHPLKARTPGAAPDRLDLARWIVDPANPLTRRVIVNDFWQHLFGHGLVRTMNDFGVRGERPTHPELFDYLADEFLKMGWSRKKLIKEIVMSAAYRQTSAYRPELADRDPDNRLLYRQNRFRVEGEIVRDLSLSASGLLSKKVGGPSVFPPMPAEVAAISYANNFKYTTSTGEDRYRRGMYTFFKRTAPHPNLMMFDCPDANAACVERNVSNTPLQALVLLNNECFVEASQGLARRMMADRLEDDASRMALGFRLCVLRSPTPLEINDFVRLLQQARSYYRSHAVDAKKLAGAKVPEGIPVEEVAAWTASARALLNMDEFLTRE